MIALQFAGARRFFSLASVFAWATFILVVAAPTSADAQIVNILAKLKAKGEQGFGGNLSASVAWKSGNTNLLQLKGTAALAYQHGQETVFLVAGGSYGLKSDDVVVSQILEHLRYRHTFNDWLQAEGFAQHEADKFRRLSARVVAGAGPRISWSSDSIGTDAAPPAQQPAAVEEPDFEIAVAFASTAMFEREVYTARGDDVLAPSSTGRLSSYLQLDLFFDKRISTHHTTFVQPRFDDFGDVRLLSQTALLVKANSWLGIKLAFNANYDSRSPEGVEHLDLGIDSALTVSL